MNTQSSLEQGAANCAVSELEKSLREEGRRRLAGSTQGFLKKHAPFQKMSADALQFFSERSEIVFYPAGTTILGPDNGNVQYFYLIESG